MKKITFKYKEQQHVHGRHSGNQDDIILLSGSLRIALKEVEVISIEDYHELKPVELTKEQIAAKETDEKGRAERLAALEQLASTYDKHYLEAARSFHKLGLSVEQIVALSIDYSTIIKTGKLQGEIDWLVENLSNIT